MKIIVKTQGNVSNLMRQCGYFFERKQGDEMAFNRPLTTSKSGYPRFHAYVKIDHVSRETRINLHLDQKKPIYQGAAAHNAEYKGEIVEREAGRIKKI